MYIHNWHAFIFTTVFSCEAEMKLVLFVLFFLHFLIFYTSQAARATNIWAQHCLLHTTQCSMANPSILKSGGRAMALKWSLTEFQVVLPPDTRKDFLMCCTQSRLS